MTRSKCSTSTRSAPACSSSSHFSPMGVSGASGVRLPSTASGCGSKVTTAKPAPLARARSLVARREYAAQTDGQAERRALRHAEDDAVFVLEAEQPALAARARRAPKAQVLGLASVEHAAAQVRERDLPRQARVLEPAPVGGG